MNIKLEQKGFLTLNEMMAEYETRPKTTYLWNGIKEKSFGLIFGPSKSGKTIFCENLAMKIAMGAPEYFGYSLDEIPKKVLFVGLEEFWENRTERNQKQFNSLSSNEKLLVGENYLSQSIDFSKRIISDEDWLKLSKMITNSKAEVVIIDSITRMNPGKLENSDTAEKIMQKLREMCYSHGITLICIHHTPKMQDSPITMDKIKGSAVFAQESDFAIGINNTTKNNRYMKTVFFRYAPDDIELVREFEIGDDIWLDYKGEVTEEEILFSTDRRRTSKNRDAIVDLINQDSSMTYKTSELTTYFSSELSIKERQIKGLLSDLTKSGEILNPERGIYTSVNKQKEEGDGKGV